MTDLKVVFTGGGSGGHVYPLLSVGKTLRRIAQSKALTVELVYMGPGDPYADILREEGFTVVTVFSAKLRRYLSIQNILDIPKFFLGFLQSLFIMFWHMPDVVFSKGGTGALPVILAARFYMIPVIIHESDAKPGLTNLLSAHFAKRIAVSFERAKNYFSPKKTAWVGTPLREDFIVGPIEAEAAKAALDFDPKSPLVLVLGGSQGSQRINEFIVTVLEETLKLAQVLHQTGKENFHEIENIGKTVLKGLPLRTEAKTRYRATPYIDKKSIAAAFSAADVIVSRAGSGTIFEIASFGKPAILIPLPESAGDHQRTNAYEFANSGGAVVIEEVNLLPNIFISELKSILTNPHISTQMSVASKGFFKPGAAEAIAEEILRLAK